ncbi:MAG: hypothetical protein KDK05_21935 [Candidatus Competibacteraceae bacterium]|nr:hypothetical protein [Candidatus Competibacteraceae bacterium]
MGKACSDAHMDAMLDNIALATTLTVCSAEPANQAGIAAVALADVTLTAGDGNGDYTVGDGDTNGRKLTVAQQADVDIDSSGTATHVVLDDGSSIYVTTCTSQALTSGGTVTIPAWDIEVADPS